jgi:hypothetical protein
MCEQWIWSAGVASDAPVGVNHHPRRRKPNPFRVGRSASRGLISFLKLPGKPVPVPSLLGTIWVPLLQFVRIGSPAIGATLGIPLERCVLTRFSIMLMRNFVPPVSAFPHFRRVSIGTKVTWIETSSGCLSAGFVTRAREPSRPR